MKWEGVPDLQDEKGIAFMTHRSGAARKPIRHPPLDLLDARAARRKAQTEGPVKGRHDEEPAHWLELTIRLALVLGVGSIPLVVLLLVAKTDIRHYISPDALPLFGACWAVFALWVTLDKGMGKISREEASGFVWLLLGLINLIGAAIFFSYVQGLP
jgi:hypothetical protein